MLAESHGSGMELAEEGKRENETREEKLKTLNSICYRILDPTR